MALDFDSLKPEAKKAAFAHMDRARGVGSFKKKGSGEIKGRLFDKPKTTRGKSSLGSGTRHKKLTAGQKSGIKAAPKITSKATPDTPEGHFDKALTEDVGKLTSGRNTNYAAMADLRKSLDARGLSRAEQDKHLKRMSAEGKLHILPEDNRKTLTQRDHDASIRVGGEPNHLVQLADAKDFPTAAAPKSKPSTDPKKLTAARTETDQADLASKFLQMHGDSGVQLKISQLEGRKTLRPGERAQLAALKSLKKK